MTYAERSCEGYCTALMSGLGSSESCTQLATHGFVVSEEQIRQTVLSPERVEDRKAEQIAQKRVSDTHVLRVVYRLEDDEIVVITFERER